MNQLVTVQQGFLCTPLEGFWSLRNTINLHGGHSDQLSTTFMLCTDMHTEPDETSQRNKVVQKIQLGYLCVQSTGLKKKNNFLAQIILFTPLSCRTVPD